MEYPPGSNGYQVTSMGKSLAPTAIRFRVVSSRSETVIDAPWALLGNGGRALSLGGVPHLVRALAVVVPVRL